MPADSGFTEIAYAIRSTTLANQAGNALTVAPIPFDSGQECLVPQMNRPCYLIGSAIISAEVGSESASASCELAIARAGTSAIALNAVLNSAHGHGLFNGERAWCFYRIPPGTPGARYQLYGTITAGNWQIIAPTHSVAFLLAIA